MYENYYGLTKKPFTIQPDPEYLFFSRRHTLAYSMLEYSIQNNAGYSVICGDIGCGKTTLVNHLVNNYKDEITAGILFNTPPDVESILPWIMMAFKLPYENMDDVSMYKNFQDFLVNNFTSGKKAVLIIDEAQNLNANALEALRVLSNISVYQHQLLQVVLVGQPQLREILLQPELEQFNQRVSVEFFLKPLEGDEIESYIRYRVNVAGQQRELFTNEAYSLIAEVSKGIPRLINIMCDLVLVYGYSSKSEIIGKELVEEVISDRKEYGVFNV